MARYVRTAAGAKRYGKPIGSLIGGGGAKTAGRGKLASAAKAAKSAGDGAGEKPARFVRTMAGEDRFQRPTGFRTDSGTKKTAERGKLSFGGGGVREGVSLTEVKAMASPASGRKAAAVPSAKRGKLTPAKKAPDKKAPPPAPTPSRPPLGMSTPEREQIAGEVADAVVALLKKRGRGHDAWTMLSNVRKRLSAGRTKEDVDAALIELAAKRRLVRLVPETNQKVLTRDERAGAVSMGNQDKHLIQLAPELLKLLGIEK